MPQARSASAADPRTSVNVRRALQAAAADLHAASNTIDALADATTRTVAALRKGGTLYSCGTGASAALAQYVAAVLVGRFGALSRHPIRALALTADVVTFSAIAHHEGLDAVIARQVEAHVAPGDVLFVFSTAGADTGLIAAAEAARHNAATVIAFACEHCSALANVADVVISAPSSEPPAARSCHLALVNALSAELERQLFSDRA